MEILKGKLTVIQPSGDLSVQIWEGGKLVITSPAFESSRIARTHINADASNFQKSALTRNILLHRGN